MTKFNVKMLSNKHEAAKVIEFFLSKKAFQMDISDYGKNARQQGVNDSLLNPSHKFWFVENENEDIVAAIGVNETERRNGGYYLDYFAVHQDYRRQKLGSILLQIVEDFVRLRNGRFIIIDTGDTKLFEPARIFYEKQGYKKVSFILDYYGVDDSRIDYYKKIS